MSSGLKAAKWNNADITASDFDVDAVVHWYAEREVPWGIRVPLEIDVRLGDPLYEKRCAALLPGTLRSIDALPGVRVRRATADDLAAYAEVERARFGGDEDLELRWLEPAIGAPGFSHWMAYLGVRAVGVAMTVATDEVAGPAAYLSGVAVVPDVAERGLEALLSSVAATAAFDAGAALVHTNPDDEDLGWMAELGFVNVPGFEVRLVEAA
jgi:hypothetical protein